MGSPYYCDSCFLVIVKSAVLWTICVQGHRPLNTDSQLTVNTKLFPAQSRPGALLNLLLQSAGPVTGTASQCRLDRGPPYSCQGPRLDLRIHARPSPGSRDPPSLPPTLPWYQITVFSLCNMQFALQHISAVLISRLLYQVTHSLDYSRSTNCMIRNQTQ